MALLEHQVLQQLAAAHALGDGQPWHDVVAVDAADPIIEEACDRLRNPPVVGGVGTMELDLLGQVDAVEAEGHAEVAGHRFAETWQFAGVAIEAWSEQHIVVVRDPADHDGMAGPDMAVEAAQQEAVAEEVLVVPADQVLEIGCHRRASVDRDLVEDLRNVAGAVGDDHVVVAVRLHHGRLDTSTDQVPVAVVVWQTVTESRQAVGDGPHDVGVGVQTVEHQLGQLLRWEVQQHAVGCTRRVDGGVQVGRDVVGTVVVVVVGIEGEDLRVPHLSGTGSNTHWQ